MVADHKSTTESFGSPLDGGRPQVHHKKLWLSVEWWPTTGPPRKALALRWMVADHRSTTESFGSPLDGGPPQVHHGKLWLCLGRLGPAKESTLAPYFPGVQCNKEVQVEGIAYSFCGLWISSVLACLCVTSQLNAPWFDSRCSLRLMGPEKRATKKPWPTLARQACQHS